MAGLGWVTEAQRHVKPPPQNPVRLHLDLLLRLAFNVVQFSIERSAKLTNSRVQAIRGIGIINGDQIAWPYVVRLGRLIQFPYLHRVLNETSPSHECPQGTTGR